MTEQTFIQAAYSEKQGRKPSKTHVADVLASLAEKHPDIMPELAMVYGHFFMPGKAPAKKASTDPWAWLALAINPKDIREYLQFIHVKDGVASATDGHRLHQVRVDSPDGHYCPRTFALVHPLGWHNFPDVARVIPDTETMESVTLARVQTLARGVTHGVTVVDLVDDTTPDGHRVCSANADYWAHATAPAQGAGMVHYRGDRDTVRVDLPTWPGALAVVMPIRGD